MNKREAIKLFKDWCLNKRTNLIRIYAFTYQKNRNVWEMDNGNCKIRIQNIDSPKIIVFLGYSHEKENGGSIFESRLSLNEYNELETIYKTV